jgi:putative nucleotidyltransferase with HDIG domain
MVVMRSSAENFKGPQGGYDLEEGELWRYSVASALVAQDLAERKHLKNVSFIFTSSLLKDIGKVILHRYVKEAFVNIMTLVEEEGSAFFEAEKEIIGIDHAEVGARVAETWNFDPQMVSIIRNHHDPVNAPQGDLALPIIYLADSICMMIGLSGGSDGLAYRHHQDIVDLLKFSDVDIQHTIANFWEKIKGVDELVSLSKGER